LKKMLSASAFHLKGNGWYETDFKNSGSKVEKKAASSNTSSGGGASK
jgi:predicted nucleic acid-binding Zn ribbon protein